MKLVVESFVYIRNHDTKWLCGSKLPLSPGKNGVNQQLKCHICWNDYCFTQSQSRCAVVSHPPAVCIIYGYTHEYRYTPHTDTHTMYATHIHAHTHKHMHTHLYVYTDT